MIQPICVCTVVLKFAESADSELHRSIDKGFRYDELYDPHPEYAPLRDDAEFKSKLPDHMRIGEVVLVEIPLREEDRWWQTVHTYVALQSDGLHSVSECVCICVCAHVCGVCACVRVRVQRSACLERFE